MLILSVENIGSNELKLYLQKIVSGTVINIEHKSV